MKKLFYTVAILGSLILFGCNDDSKEVYEELEPINLENLEKHSRPVDFDLRK